MTDKFTLTGVWTLSWYQVERDANGKVINWWPDINGDTNAKYDDWEIEFLGAGGHFKGNTGSEQNFSPVTGQMYEWSAPGVDTEKWMRLIALHMQVGPSIHHVHCGHVLDAPGSTASGDLIRGYWVGVAGQEGAFTLKRKATIYLTHEPCYSDSDVNAAITLTASP